MKVIKKKLSSRPLSQRRELMRYIRYLSDDKIELLLNTAKSFKVADPTFNAKTVAALKEADRISRDPNTKRYNNFTELLTEIQNEI